MASPTSPAESPLLIPRSKDHADGLLTSLADLQKTSTLCDFIIEVEGRSIYVHRCVLGAACDYFRTMLGSGMKEAREGVVRLDGLDFDVVQTVIDFIYGNDVTINWDDVTIKQYLDIAESFGLSEFKHILEGYITGNLNPENCIEWYGLAERYHLKKLKLRSRKMLRRNFVKASMSPAFEALSLAELQELLSDEVIKSQQGDHILSTCIFWTLSDEPNRKNSFGELVKVISLEQCSPDYLKFVLDSYMDSLLTDVKVYAEITQGIIAAMKLKEVTEEKAAEPNLVNKKTSGNSCKPVIVVGGQSSILSLNQSVFRIDFNNSTMEEIAALPESMIRFFPARCQTCQGLFSMGGGTQCLPSTATQDCALFDVDTGQLAHLPSLSFPVYASGAAAIGNKVYVMGGFGREDQTHYLDLNTRTWGVCARMKLQVQRPIACSIRREIFVLSNTSKQKEISLQCYDTPNNVWSIRARPPTVVSSTNGACVVTVDLDLFILGGDGRLCLRYSTMEDRWALLSQPRADHGYGSAVHVDGKIFLCGGRDQGVYSALMEVYDIRANQWEVCDIQLPCPLLDLSVFPQNYVTTSDPEEEEDMWVLVKGEDDKDLERKTSVDNIKCEVVG